jgi:hypothetical protein
MDSRGRPPAALTDPFLGPLGPLGSLGSAHVPGGGPVLAAPFWAADGQLRRLT